MILWTLLACLPAPPAPDTVDWDGDGHLEPDDCDDGDATVYPGAVEGCDDVDQDCDGVFDCPLVSAPIAKLNGGAGDQAGSAVAGVGDLDGDGFDDFMVGGAGLGESEEGGAWLVYGPLAPGDDLALDDAPARFLGELANDLAGAHVALAGKVNDDDYEDILVSWRRSPENFPGGFALWYGGPDRFSGDYDVGAAPVRFEGEVVSATGEQLGIDIATAGPALLIGAMYHTESREEPYAGCAYVVPYDAIPASGTITDTGTVASMVFLGEEGSDFLGESVASGDLDGDDVPDFIVGGRGAGGGDSAGGVYIFLGRSTAEGLVHASDADAVWLGDADGDAVANYGELTALADVDGDGRQDVLVGASGHREGTASTGAVFLVSGNSLLLSDTLSNLADTTFVGPDGAPIGASSGGDFDNDGVLDIAVASPQADDSAVDAGAVWMFYGPLLDGVHNVTEASAQLTGEAEGDALSGGLSATMSIAGDIDGDGLLDILFGASGQDEGGQDAGAAYVLFGGRM